MLPRAHPVNLTYHLLGDSISIHLAGMMLCLLGGKYSSIDPVLCLNLICLTKLRFCSTVVIENYENFPLVNIIKLIKMKIPLKGNARKCNNLKVGGGGGG